MVSKSETGLLYNLQLLRALAAIAVAYKHIAGPIGVNIPFHAGAFGVDIFFAISGFIICYMTSSDPTFFLRKRIIRIVPFYWVATIAVFVAAQVVPGAFHHVIVTSTNFIHSLIFIPPNTMHGTWPLITWGWTLNYEMYFYVLFSISLTISKTSARAICAALIVATLILAKALSPAVQEIGFYAQNIVLEFIFGMALFPLYRMFPEKPKYRGFYLAIIGVLIVAIFVELAVQEYYVGHRWRAFSAGIPAALLVGLFLLLEKSFGVRSRAKIMLLLGEASYVLYLIHPYVTYLPLRTFLSHAVFWGLGPKIAVIIGLMIFSCAAAVIVHLYFERPLIDVLRRRFLRKPPPVIFQPAGAS